MLPVFFAPRRGGWRRSVPWLAAMLFFLRALLPTGFMPDPGALRAGRFQLVYCNASAPMPVGMAMAAHGMAMAAHGMAHPRHLADHHAPTAPDGASMPADCPFGLTGAYTCLPPLPAVVAPVLALAWHMPAPPPFPSPRSGITGGPPVGSRAPPPDLA